MSASGTLDLTRFCAARAMGSTSETKERERGSELRLSVRESWEEDEGRTGEEWGEADDGGTRRVLKDDGGG